MQIRASHKFVLQLRTLAEHWSEALLEAVLAPVEKASGVLYAHNLFAEWLSSAAQSLDAVQSQVRGWSDPPKHEPCLLLLTIPDLREGTFFMHHVFFSI